MPTDWSWWAGAEGHETFDLAVECSSRDEALTEALRNADDDEVIVLVEARMSTDMKYEGSDFVPFTHTRNREIIGKRGPAALTPTNNEVSDEG